MSDFERPATAKVRCPKCGGNDLLIVETGTWTSTWEVVSGRLDREAGFHNPESVDRVDVECRTCGHSWKPRKAWQIDDIVIEDAHEASPAHDTASR